MQKRRDPVMEAFRHHDNLVEIRRVIRRKPRLAFDPKKVALILSVVLLLTVFWFGVMSGIRELFK